MRVGNDKPRQTKYYIEGKVKHHKKHSNMPLPTRHQARDLTQKTEPLTNGKAHVHGIRFRIVADIVYYIVHNDACM